MPKQINIISFLFYIIFSHPQKCHRLIFFNTILKISVLKNLLNYIPFLLYIDYIEEIALHYHYQILSNAFNNRVRICNFVYIFYRYILNILNYLVQLTNFTEHICLWRHLFGVRLSCFYQSVTEVIILNMKNCKNMSTIITRANYF